MFILATVLVGALQLLSSPPTVEVPVLDVQAPLVAVGFDEDGGMEIPQDVNEIGIWKYGTAPGDNVVLVGHVSSRTQGRGVFYDIRDLQSGDVVFLGDDSFTVRETATMLKRDLPVEEIFIGDSVEELVLVTCGGWFDDDTRHFDSNVVVWAVPT